MPSSPLSPGPRGLDLAAADRAAQGRALPPVDRWDPPHCGHSGMRIARDGTWFHDGAPIRRAAMVRLFSTILRREPDGSHVLVTPVEKLTIDVEATAFRAVAMDSEGVGRARCISLTLDSGDRIPIDGDHPLRLANEPLDAPRILVRHGLEAALTRPVYYDLAHIALDEGADPAGVWSNGCFFVLDSGQ